MEALQQLNQAPGVLQSALDLSRILIGGHSAGGTVALLNANPDWFKGLCGVFSYAAHTGASTALGHPPNTILPLPGDCPALLMGGTADGVIAASGSRYGDSAQSSTERIEATFAQAVPDRAGANHLVLLQGANHFTFVHPRDDSTGRAFLEGDESGSGQLYRTLMSQLIGAFAQSVCKNEAGDQVAEVIKANAGLVALHLQK
jgi:pimeloyl-ACP methyl ester carboxylesterase